MSVKTSQMTFNLLEGNNDLKIYIIVLQDLNALNKEKKPQSFLVCILLPTYNPYSMQDHKIYLNTFMQ